MFEETLIITFNNSDEMLSFITFAKKIRAVSLTPSVMEKPYKKIYKGLALSATVWNDYIVTVSQIIIKVLPNEKVIKYHSPSFKGSFITRLIRNRTKQKSD